MTRRIWLAAALGLPGRSGVEPRNALVDAANAHQRQYVVWGEAMNAERRPGVLSARVVAGWEPLPELWRRVEGAWRRWVLGG